MIVVFFLFLVLEYGGCLLAVMFLYLSFFGSLLYWRLPG